MSYILALKVGHQNIQGSGKTKLCHNDLIKKVKDHHLFGIQESKLGKNNAAPDIEGYTKFRSDKKKKGARESGGSIIYVKRCVARGVRLLSKRSNESGDVIWLRLRKEFFGLDEDIILSYCYITPNAKNEAYEILRNEIEDFSRKGLITILGDLNSRIGHKEIIHSEIIINDSQTIVKKLKVPKRTYEDKKINGNGRKLSKIMSDYNLMIANGTVVGDLLGKYTCVAWNGMSTNDLFLFHRRLASRINYFKIEKDFDWYSDHKAVSVSIRVNIIPRNEGNAKFWSKYFKPKLSWNQENITKFKSVLSDEKYKNKLINFCSKNHSSTDEAAAEFGSIINNILMETFPAIKKRQPKKDKRKQRDENFSPIVQAAKRNFRKQQREFNIDQNDLDRRQRFIRERQKYKQAIYVAKMLAKDKKINKIKGLENSDPKSFWKDLKSLINPNSDMTEYIEKNEWFNHFNELLNAPKALNQDEQFLEYVKTSLPRLELYAENVESLNTPITKSEMEKSIKDLKLNKSTFSDNIGNEVIKYGYDILGEALIILYNKIFTEHNFPKNWGDGLVIPLHKKDDKMDVNNYRGIIISSSLGKFFLRIINKRIEKFMSDHNKWAPNQCGFKKDHRTEDNLLLLRTIHEKYVKRGKKKVFVAFVDFSKFFDKINRHIMFYKLLKYGITGNIYHLIKSVYNNTTYKIKIGDSVSPTFTATNGLKQGCCMSPILSNIFQNDLHEIFDNDCDPITIGDAVLNSISWADDLILLSTSKDGLQRCLSKLSSYCKKWGLEVNVDKTKTMVFSNKFDSTATFYYNGTALKNVKTMLYLGFNFSYNGNLNSIINDRIDKSKKVAFMVLNALRTNKNVSTSLALSVYEKQIAPVLMYGCSVWAVPRNGNLLYIEDQPEHINTRSKLNEIFNDLFGTTLSFEYAKRVGKYIVGQKRRILIKMSNYEDKQKVLSHSNLTYKFSDYEEKCITDTNKTYVDFCKRSLNISKYASNTATYFELGCKPIDNKMLSLTVKYWLRLANGTENQLLNQAYAESLEQNYEWTQGIKYLLFKNGFGDVWQMPESVNQLNFHKTFKNRLNDQFDQNILSKLDSSTRFDVLKTMIDNETVVKRQRYIETIKNPSIRESFTRLRIDINILENSKQNIDKSPSGGICSNCSLNARETTTHLLLKCSKFSAIRDKFYTMIRSNDPNFNQNSMSEHDLLRYILDLRCPDENIAGCCSIVKNIYDARVELTKG